MVLLPLPDGPTIDTDWPASIENDTLFNAGLSA